ncbi:DUF975 family protein [uncultured Clostridium sp.]|jgi:hypothetical protein|uniref:DUF975 family protein n=1 Tax=uncultured Clostridium sp. TaxID=59620 RepID=UPI002624ACA6|nr:DUF975 family protein [uncultured Clostridium sp.]
MPTRIELKNLAKRQLKEGNYWTFVINFAIYAVLVAIIGGLKTVENLSLTSSILTLLVLVPIQFGLFFTAIRITQGKLHICSFMCFISSGFSKYIKIIGLGIVLSIIVSVGTVLFIIPGIIWGLMFSQSIFIMCTKDCTIFEALDESRNIMKGHKWELFILEWSFVLWGILITITGGLGTIFIGPYILTTFANYYRELQLDYEKKNYQGGYENRQF